MGLVGPLQLAPFAGVFFPGDPGFSRHYAAAPVPCFQSRPPLGRPPPPPAWRHAFGAAEVADGLN